MHQAVNHSKGAITKCSTGSQWDDGVPLQADNNIAESGSSAVQSGRGERVQPFLHEGVAVEEAEAKGDVCPERPEETEGGDSEAEGFYHFHGTFTNLVEGMLRLLFARKWPDVDEKYKIALANWIVNMRLQNVSPFMQFCICVRHWQKRTAEDIANAETCWKAVYDPWNAIHEEGGFVNGNNSIDACTPVSIFSICSIETHDDLSNYLTSWEEPAGT